ncbi:predicted protein [Sclerotinia sclerotiorum 1980 UF-70]|uniref:Uncharacterized protein n=1 Tax=Sclerotinia sclerotiorum (strain ATCC 18683 / 1980 / Ss-1) TaxID=665079 RepID=A7EWI5_SCLS1|nr:predicted protein [Sclerotinia sclerotiorum 1980 UF-70]EDN93827.1 predicted protein [Sclerotinia sclerotiorum 1980 UF-70]
MPQKSKSGPPQGGLTFATNSLNLWSKRLIVGRITVIATSYSPRAANPACSSHVVRQGHVTFDHDRILGAEELYWNRNKPPQQLEGDMYRNSFNLCA